MTRRWLVFVALAFVCTQGVAAQKTWRDASPAVAHVPKLQASVLQPPVPPPPPSPLVVVPVQLDDTYKVPLNNTGIADVHYLNPRLPFPVVRTSKGTKVINGVEFQNRTFDRKFDVTMKITLKQDASIVDSGVLKKLKDLPLTDSGKEGDAARKTAETYYHVQHLGSCKKTDKEEGMACTVTVTITRSMQAGGALFSARLLNDATDTTLTFKVRRFGENDKLSRSKGYLRLDGEEDKPIENDENPTTVTPVASVGLTVDPRLAATGDDEIINTDNPLNGERHTHFPGSARLDVEQDIGNRARVDLAFKFNKADFGDATDSKGNVSASQYKVTVTALNMTTLEFGKYDFVDPGDGIAFTESGQGFSLSRPFNFATIRASYLIKQEGASTRVSNPLPPASADTPDAPKRDHADAIVEVNNINLRENVALNLLGLYGSDDADADPHVYRAVGFESFFTFHEIRGKRSGNDNAPPDQCNEAPSAQLGGSLAAFRANRSGKSRGKGTTALGRLVGNFGIRDCAKADEATIPHTLTFSAGLGSSDKASTSNVNEGYIGEEQDFAPDELFFGRFDAALNKGDATRFTSTGLSNKIYTAIEYTNNDWSLLRAAAHAVGVDDADIVSQSTTISARHYRFRDTLLPTKDLGTELAAVFDIETPQSVTVKLGVAYFMPSGALSSLMRKNVWSVAASVKLEP